MIRLLADAVAAMVRQIAGLTPLDVLRRPPSPVVEGATRPAGAGGPPPSAAAGAGGHPNRTDCPRPADWETSELLAWAGMRIALDCRHNDFDARVARALFDRANYFAALVGD